MQANIASNDLTLKVINQTLQYVVKTPLVILVPNSDDINDHRSEFSNILCTPMVQKKLRQVYLTFFHFFRYKVK